MKNWILCVVCLGAATTIGFSQEVAKPPNPPKVWAGPLSEAEEFHRQALANEWQLIQERIKAAVNDHSSKLNEFVKTTLEAHGKPKGVTFDAQTYQFVETPAPKSVAEPAPEVKPKP